MMADLQKYIISLGNPLDKERMKYNNLPKGSYEIVKGVTPEQVPGFVEAKFIKGRLSDERRGALMGAFTAHFRAWEKIKADGDKGGIVLESDAQLLRNMACDIDDLPDSGITALGGNFRFKATDGYDNETIFKWLGKVPKPLFSVKGMTWINCVAYYVPPKMASFLVKQAFEGPRVLRSPDNWLTHEKLIHHAMFPTPYGTQEGRSNIPKSKAADGMSDVYLCLGMRKACRLVVPLVMGARQRKSSPSR